MNIGIALRTCRISKGLSQRQLSEQAGLSISYLSYLERNRRDPTISTLVKIAKSLEIPLYLLVFMASEWEELMWADQDLQEKLSLAVIQYLKRS